MAAKVPTELRRRANPGYEETRDFHDLAGGRGGDEDRKANAAVAIAAVIGIAVVDLVTALSLTAETNEPPQDFRATIDDLERSREPEPA